MDADTSRSIIIVVVSVDVRPQTTYRILLYILLILPRPVMLKI